PRNALICSPAGLAAAGKDFRTPDGHRKTGWLTEKNGMTVVDVCFMINPNRTMDQPTRRNFLRTLACAASTVFWHSRAITAHARSSAERFVSSSVACCFRIRTSLAAGRIVQRKMSMKLAKWRERFPMQDEHEKGKNGVGVARPGASVYAECREPEPGSDPRVFTVER